MHNKSSHDDINVLLEQLEMTGELVTGIKVANKIVELLGSKDISQPDLVIDEKVLQLPNSERFDHWFQSHPWMGGERSVFEITDATDAPIQAKFYFLKKRSRQFIAGSVHFTENWEDADYTRTDKSKIGIDFFLSPTGKSLMVALSNRGNIRIVELQHKLNNTQVEIFSKWRNATQVTSVALLHDLLWESFKLQSVNKEFYSGVSDSFTELLQHLKSTGRNEEDAKLFASRLLGRLLFTWFLRKKHIIDESMGYFNASSESSTTYYKHYLEPLFFKTLNTPLEDRDNLAKDVAQKSLFIQVNDSPQAELFKADQKTPYLNGGLFEPHENDWYGDAHLTFPEGFFANLYDHFDKFNFTTDESSPEYEQVAIDPEMLGRVFESLLATQVDETGQQARKAKGAFYTPREIVSYMCKESLRNYLYGANENDDRYRKSIDELLDRSDHKWAVAGTNSRRDAVPKEYRTTILDSLDSLTILDPACGSGAFPMGMVQLLFKTYERLESRFDPYAVKLKIIEKNIFGVDIEPMAVEISRLRAWLSLIIDEEDSQTAAPLPNLDFKFVCANSLIPLDNGESHRFNNPELHMELADIRKAYFNARKPHTKKAAQDKYYKLTSSKKGILDNLRTKQLKSFDPFINSRSADFFDMDQMFGIENGFDVVIGNPPYVGEKGHKGIFDKIKASSFGKRFYLGKMDLFYFFFHLGLDTLKEGGYMSFITTNYYPTATGAKKLIQDIRDRSEVISLVNFNELKIFESALGQHNMVTMLQKNTSENKDKSVSTTSVISKNPNDRDVLNNILNKTSIEATYNYSKQRDLYDGPYIRLTRNNLDIILDKVAEQGQLLGSICNVNQGIVSGADKFSDAHAKKFPNVQAKKGDGIFVVPKNMFNDNVFLRPWYKNSDIYRYSTSSQSEESLIFANKNENNIFPANLLEYLMKFKPILDSSSSNSPYLHRPRGDIFEGPKIVAPQRSPRNTFGYNENDWYASADVYFITTKDDQPNASLKFILGLLNSRLYFVWLYSRGKRKGSMLELYQNPLSEVPIKSGSQELMHQIESRVNKIILLKNQDESVNTEDQENQIDELVYSLYELSTDEIRQVNEFCDLTLKR